LNIIVINHYAGGPSFGMEFRHYYLAKEWVKSGHKVLIVASSFSHLRSVQPQVSSSSTEFSIGGIDYVWLKTNPYSGNGVGRILNIFLFIFRLYFNLGKKIKAFSPDLIIASSTYPLDNLPARFFARKNKSRLCYEVKDVWPLSPMELGGYSKYHPFIAIMQYAESFAYRHADFVVSTLPKTKDHMVLHGMQPEKFCYIPNGISLDEWAHGNLDYEHKDFFDNLKRQNKVIVGYVGGHAISNALDTLLDVATKAQLENPDFVFVLIGDGAEKQRLIKAAKDSQTNNIYFLSPVRKNSVPSVLQAMDILYIGWQNNPLYRFGISPNKLMDYMMSAKPIVHSVKAANDPVSDSGCGVSVEPGNPQRILQALSEINQMKAEEQLKIGLMGRDYVVKHYNYVVLAKKFIDFCSFTIQN
jgi:glycosyltransferase involved in cell wall biosynthesis